jgi:hypothetical protein
MNTTNMESSRAVNPFGAAPIVAAPTSASAQALAAREATHIQAAMLIAQGRPRDPRESVDRLLIACTRVALAEEAMYSYSRGGTEITGPTIRLAEEAARCWRNMLFGVAELSRSDGTAEAMAYAWDLETLVCDERRFHVRLWRDTRKGGYAVTDERDIYELVANMGARRKRACILSCIPGDVIAAAVDQCEKTLRAKADVTPERIEGMLEKFAAFRVTKEMIERRIQRRIDAISPAALLQLGKIHNALRDGLGQVSDYFEVPTPATAIASGDAPRSTGEAVKDALREKGRGRKSDAAKEPSHGAGGKEGGTDAPASVPYFSVESAIAALRAANTVEDVEKAWKAITQDFRESNRSLPIDVEAVFNERSEMLAEAPGDDGR